MSPFRKGQVPWNKGITGKDSHMYGRRHTLGKQAWNRGLTRSKDGRVAQPWLGKARSEETKRKISNSHKKSGHMPPKEVRARGKKHPNYGKPIMALSLLRLGALNSRKKLALRNPTNIEIVVDKFLSGSGVDYESQRPIDNRYLVDFFVPSKNLVIECDGEYWHSLAGTRKKDALENAYLKKQGYNLIRISERDILNGMYEEKLLKWL